VGLECVYALAHILMQMAERGSNTGQIQFPSRDAETASAEVVLLASLHQDDVRSPCFAIRFDRVFGDDQTFPSRGTAGV
jgi:hypothetical protein